MSDTMTIPTVEQVHETLKRVINEKGRDYVYEQPVVSVNEHGEEWTECVYADGNKPSCLIGTLMHELGVPLAKLSMHEGTAGDTVWAVLIEGADPRTTTGHNKSAMATAVRAAQRAQDHGLTWGVALAAFEESLGLTQG